MPIEPLRRIANLLAATGDHLRVELAALGEEGASFHPAAGEWCTKEVIGHLIEADRRGFAGRVEQILAADRPSLRVWDQAGVAAARSDCERPVGEVLDEFAAGRRAGLLLLERLAVDDLGRVGIHPEVGEMTVSDVLHEWPFHDRDHLKQMLANTRAWLWPDLGSARRFTEERGGEI
jgi:hypothetical protein